MYIVNDQLKKKKYINKFCLHIKIIVIISELSY